MSWIQLVLIVGLAFYVIADDQKAVQFFTKYGYYDPYSFAGDRLTNAILAYQKFNRLQQTGILDVRTKEEMAKPRCGMADIRRGTNTFYSGSSKWKKDSLTYKFLNYGLDMPKADVENAIQQAFDKWAAVAKIQFTRVVDDVESDIKIGFFSKEHGDGYPFDGKQGVLGHAFYPRGKDMGKVHFDEDETWAIDGSISATGLLYVATHELGHSLGLGHSGYRDALMYPSYSRSTSVAKLNKDDIRGIQSLYGSIGGTPVECHDKRYNCAFWAKNNYCFRFKSVCPKSCGLCK